MTRQIHQSAGASRTAFRPFSRAIVWLMVAGAGLFIFGLLFAAVTGNLIHWRFRIGNDTYIVFLPPAAERFRHPSDQPPPAPNQTVVSSQNHVLGQGSFILGHWVHAYKDLDYSSAPRPSLNARNYRRAIEYDRKDIWLDPAWCIPLLLLLPMVALLTKINREVQARRRRWRSEHCVKCGYDLRASPMRCPECGTIRSDAAEPNQAQ